MAKKEWRFKPLKAGECSFELLKLPCWATPKIDGINGLKILSAGELLMIFQRKMQKKLKIYLQS